MTKLSAKYWFRIGLINLMLVAVFGTLMRYKIAFDFPFFHQKNLLHAHSHFAFSGWVSHFLYTGLAYLIIPYLSSNKKRVYDWLITLNLVCAFGMLIAFTVQGYGAVSITFSTLSIVVSLAFAIQFGLDLKYFPKNHRSKPWAVVGLLLNVLSAVGPFTLAYMLSRNEFNHELYLGSVYYYLHFQYNGWFFFGSMAIILSRAPLNFPSLKKYFWIFALSIVPTFFLSILWIDLPNWIYTLTVITTFLQLGAWIGILIAINKFFQIFQKNSIPKWIQTFFHAAIIALTLKFILQAISVIPSLSQLVFGIRPIVIAYLHLILLGVFSLFIFGYLFMNKYLNISNVSKNATFFFLFGVIVNETLLAIQGFGAFFYFPIPFINEMLLGAALILVTSASVLVYSQFRVK